MTGVAVMAALWLMVRTAMSARPREAMLCAVLALSGLALWVAA